MKTIASALCILFSAATVTPLPAQTPPDPMVCKEIGRALTDREVFVLVLREAHRQDLFRKPPEMAVDLSSDDAIHAYIDANPDCCYRNKWPGYNPNGSFNGIFGADFDERYSRSQGIAHFEVGTEYPTKRINSKTGLPVYYTKMVTMSQCGGFAYEFGTSNDQKWSPGGMK
jgi:hypothetical protein